jgi:phosphate transport system protein
MPQHTDRAYDAELAKISNTVSHMGGQLEEILAGAAHALRDRNVALAQHMIEADRKINRTELSIDGMCMHVLALRQPVAGDLRFIMSVLKVVTDLERIGDLAKNVCERIVELGEATSPRVLAPKLDDMMERVRDMVRTAVRAFVERDASAAQEVRLQDDPVDELYHEVLRELLAEMKENPQAIVEATALQSTAKYIERIGDHATNVAEQIVFMVEGTDVRHPTATKTTTGPITSA